MENTMLKRIIDAVEDAQISGSRAKFSVNTIVNATHTPIAYEVTYGCVTYSNLDEALAQILAHTEEMKHYHKQENGETYTKEEVKEILYNVYGTYSIQETKKFNETHLNGHSDAPSDEAILNATIKDVESFIY